jgi:hypothetical protein
MEMSRHQRRGSAFNFTCVQIYIDIDGFITSIVSKLECLQINIFLYLLLVLIGQRAELKCF